MYALAKTLHIVLIAGWFAGLFYLPRILVNLAMESNETARNRLLLMGDKLYRFMWVLAVPAIALGLWLWLGEGLGKGQGWVHAKLLVLLLILGFHHSCGTLLKKFKLGKNTRSHVFYRWYNEVPLLLLLAATVLVVYKPF